MAAVMPILSLVLENAKGMKVFGLFDFLKGFWQLPLAEFCQEWLSYMTDEKVFTPRRVPQGSSDAAIFFQKTMEECFKTLLYKHLLIWIDDIMLYAEDIDVYLVKLQEMLSLVDTFGLKLGVKKCSLYQTQVKWCGRVVDEHGVRYDEDRLATLRAIPYPSTAGELQQFICGVNWLRDSLVDFARTAAPLQTKLDHALANTRKTSRAAAGINIQLTSDERAAFDAVKDLLINSATLAHPSDHATTCLFTDASQTGWAVVVTQVDDFDPKVPIVEQQHRLLQCLSGTFTGSQLNWSVTEKEAFPLIMAVDKLDYILLRPQAFRIYCDHRNLIHIFAPNENMKKHVRGKLLRWSMKLMNHHYIIAHIPGSLNVWADMISRWAGPTCRSTVLKRIHSAEVTSVTTSDSAVDSCLRPLDNPDFCWPSLEELRSIQVQHPRPQQAVQNEQDLLLVDGRMWVPHQADEFIQRLFIIAHCGAQGHRGLHAMQTHLSRLFWIESLSSIAAKFIQNCRLCLHVKGGKIVPRPWSETIDCATRNEVLHFDYLYMGKSFGPSTYLLVLKDHATHYTELIVADSASSNVVVDALLAWHSRFGLPTTWVSDNGSHFKNEVMDELCRRLRSKQQFTPAYSPWVNGSVERVNRDILQVMRALLLTYKVSHRDWVYFVPIVQASLNHTPVPSLGNRAPVELFTGLPCPSPLREFRIGDQDFQTIPENVNDIDQHLSKLREHIQEMHGVVADQRLKQQLLNRKRERGENLVNFDVGDYVLRSRVDEKHANKLLVTWLGPYQVVRSDTHSFRVKHLVTGDELDVHASRLKFYADSSLNVTSELREHVASQGILLAVEQLLDHRWNGEIHDYELKVRWKGLEPIEDSYEPLQSLARDINMLVGSYVTTVSDADLSDYWKRYCSGEFVADNSSWLPRNLQQPVPPKVRDKPAPKNAGKKRRKKSDTTSLHDSAVPVTSESTQSSASSVTTSRRTDHGGVRTRSMTELSSSGTPINPSNDDSPTRRRLRSTTGRVQRSPRKRAKPNQAQ